MAKFRFPLQALLEYREHIERQKQLAVARVEVERRDSEERIGGYQQDIRRMKDELRRMLSPRDAQPGSGEGADPRGARMQAGASLHTQMRAHREVVKLAGIHKRLEGVRVELTKAAINRRAMEKLRENRLEAWKAEESKKENAALDEIATIRAARMLIEEAGGQPGRLYSPGNQVPAGASPEFLDSDDAAAARRIE